ncbi:MAG: VOC family protein [Thermomicrobiales bacterium]|nr:VOC family protein [Thermomicrobiales bacterium]
MASVLRIQHVSVPMPPGGEEEARRFYSGALGLQEKTPPVALADLDIVWFHAGADGLEVHVFTDRTGQSPVQAQHLCLQVDALDDFRAALESRGIATEDAVAIHNRPRFFIRDPFGNQIEITQVLGAYL